MNSQLCAVNYKRLNALKCITARSSVPRALSHLILPQGRWMQYVRIASANEPYLNVITCANTTVKRFTTTTLPTSWICSWLHVTFLLKTICLAGICIRTDVTDEGPCVETNGAHVIAFGFFISVESVSLIRKLILSLSFCTWWLWRNDPMWACFYLLGGSNTAVLKSGELHSNPDCPK